MDSIRVKSMISDINEILNKNYNILSFDLLNPTQLLQVLSDVLSNVEGTDIIDLRQEALDETVLRILEMLRILKYKPENEDVPPSLFRQGLVQGDKKIIFPILDWLVSNLEDLKKRSYLARFLVKLDLPPEILADPDVGYLYEQYEGFIEEFKNVHKESEVLKDTAMSVAELRSDIKAMEAERDSVLKKIDKLKRRVESFPGKEKLLEAAKALRVERERSKELQDYEEKQRSLIVTNEQKVRRLSTQLQEIRQNSGRASPHDLIRRMEEECSVNAYLCQQKLPMEIQAREEDLNIYETVINHPSLSRAHLDELTFKIQQVSAEVTHMVETQLAEQNPGEDKNAPFRQQAAIIARKKESKAEQLAELRSQLSMVEEELSGKQQQLNAVAGNTVLRGDDLKKYVSKLRTKGALYKKQKSQLATLKTEAGVLTRTLEILAVRDKSVMQALANEEAVHGVEGYRETRSVLEMVSEAKSEVDTSKGKTLEEMSKLVVELTQKVAAKKASLEPLIAELRPLREQFQETKDQHDQLKKVYDATAAGLENQTYRLQQEVDRLQKDLKTAEDELERLERENEKAEEDLVKVAEEVKLYVSGSAEAKKNSLREQLQQKIAEHEKTGKQLKEEQLTVRDLQLKSAQQVKYWTDVERLMKCKIECFEEAKKGSGIVRREKGAETLILTQ